MMSTNRKPLHPYEQSMLLVSMLFDGKNINEILSILPEHQSARMHAANEKFIKMPRNERMTEIVFELRRLLLVDEHRIDWIHQTWIDDALSKEPEYLRPIIDAALKNGSHKKTDDDARSFVPLPVIFNMFIDQLINTRQKTAIYDAVLMRLQSLKDEGQEEVFAELGRRSLLCLQEKVPPQRFQHFLTKRGLAQLPCTLDEKKVKQPFSHGALRSHFLRELAQFKPTPHISLLQFAGLVTTALYLLPFKYHWQRTIALVLHQRLGTIVEAIIKRRSKLILQKAAHLDLADVIIASLESSS